MRVKSYFFTPFLVFMGMMLVSCATQKDSARSTPERVFEAVDTTNKAMETSEKSAGVDFSDITPTTVPITPSSSSNGGSDKEVQPIQAVSTPSPKNAVPSHYRVILDANKEITVPGEVGTLKVWIGDSAYEQPEKQGDMVRAKTVISNTKAKQWAKVSPYGEAFTITPVEPISCIEIDPSGSEVRFSLIPKESKSGEYKVGAMVYLYGREDCSDTPIPKFSADLKVNVRVNKKEVAKAIVYARGEELWEVFWKGLMDFWGALIAAVFGTILFMVRKKLKNWFGYSKEKSE